METFFWFSDQIEAPDEPVQELTSNFDDMITAILTQTPDPRLYERDLES